MVNGEWTTVVMGALNLMIYHCLRKTILIGDGLSAYITKYIFINITGIKLHF